jgi:site-specific DNA recombinase
VAIAAAGGPLSGPRTSTDQQGPTLSLPRQLDNSRRAMPAQFVIVAKFYDIESGRNDLEHRGQGDAHKRFDIPIARDGGIADMLDEAKRPGCFVAVVCEPIERVARVSYFSTKIEYELAPGESSAAALAVDAHEQKPDVSRHQGRQPMVPRLLSPNVSPQFFERPLFPEL